MSGVHIPLTSNGLSEDQEARQAHDVGVDEDPKSQMVVNRVVHSLEWIDSKVNEPKLEALIEGLLMPEVLTSLFGEKVARELWSSAEKNGDETPTDQDEEVYKGEPSSEDRDIPKFMDSVAEAIQLPESDSEKPRPVGLNEDFTLESSLAFPVRNPFPSCSDSLSDWCQRHS